MEKYFSDSINLVKIGYDEIFDKHRYLYSMTEDDLMFAYEMPHQIVKELEDIIKIKQDVAPGKKSDEENVIGEQIVELQQSVLTISNNMCNSRKVKQYFKGVEKDFKTLEFQKDLFQSELKDANWKEKIVRIHFLKRFFPQSYHDIEIQSRIQDCAESYNSSVAALILGNGFLFSFPDEKDIIMINEIIYHWDAVDWRRISTEREGYEERLAKNTIQEGDIEKYILYAKDFNAMEKILNLYETNNKTDGERKVFFDFYFSQITRLLESRIFDVTEALAFYNEFVWCLGQINLSKREQKLYGEKGKLVADTIIRQNVSVFSDIILLTKGVTFIKDKWQLVSDLNTLYANLYRLDGDYFRSNTADDDTFNKVRRYYTDIGKVFMAEHAEGDVKKFEGLFVDVQAVLLLYDGWSNLDRNYLGYNYKKEDAFKKYFTFENSYTYKSDVFSSVDALKDAYVTYLIFLKSIEIEEYTCVYEELFVRVLAETVYRAESDKAWFGDNYLYICSAAQVIIDELARFKEHDKAAMNKIEIYFYRLNYMA